MKSALLNLAALLALSSLTAQAETLISSRVVKVPVDISTNSIVYTSKGYSVFLVKVLVPELAGPTLMNHRNEGERAPCLATYEATSVDEVVQGRPETVEAEVKIDLIKDANLGSDNVCRVTLREDLTTVIRGFTFVHSRSTQLPDRIAADCQ